MAGMMGVTDMERDPLVVELRRLRREVERCGTDRRFGNHGARVRPVDARLWSIFAATMSLLTFALVVLVGLR